MRWPKNLLPGRYALPSVFARAHEQTATTEWQRLRKRMGDEGWVSVLETPDPLYLVFERTELTMVGAGDQRKASRTALIPWTGWAGSTEVPSRRSIADEVRFALMPTSDPLEIICLCGVGGPELGIGLLTALRFLHTLTLQTSFGLAAVGEEVVILTFEAISDSLRNGVAERLPQISPHTRDPSVHARVLNRLGKTGELELNLRQPYVPYLLSDSEDPNSPTRNG